MNCAKADDVYSDGRAITLQVAVLFATAVVAAQAIICQFDDSRFDPSLHLFGQNVLSALGAVLDQSSHGDEYQQGHRGTLSPGTHPNVNCC